MQAAAGYKRLGGGNVATSISPSSAVANAGANRVLFLDSAQAVSASTDLQFNSSTGHASIGTSPDSAGPYAATVFSRQYIYESKTTIGNANIEAPLFVFSNINLTASEAGNACSGASIYQITQSGNARNVGYMYTLSAYAHHNGSGTITDLEAVSGGAVNYETGTVTYMAGGFFSVGNAASGGTLTKASALNASVYIDHGTITQVRGLALEFWYKSAGTVSTSYGIYADSSIDIGSTRYFIYSLSTSPSLFSGAITVPDGTAAAPGIRLSTQASGLYYVGNLQLGFTVDGTARMVISNTQLVISSSHAITWASGGIGTASDLNLARLAAGQMAVSGAGTTANTPGTAKVNIKMVAASVTCTAGATVTAAGLIPDGAFVVGVSTRVTTAIGAGSGTTGYQVGDGSDADRWGAINGITTGTSSNNSDATANFTGAFTAANDIVLTAVGGNFDGTGVVRVVVHYIDTTASAA